MIKNALLVYNYPWRKGYCPFHANIGDYIQSLAAKQFLPGVDVFVDRDSVASYSGDPIKLIMNGWWHLYRGTEIISDAVIPLYVSFHIANPKGVTKRTLEHLKKYAPIGCRDLTTMNYLQNNGVEAYFSSCLTLTLGKTYHIPKEERTNTVYFVDCDFLGIQKLNLREWCLSWNAWQSCLPANKKLKQRTLEIIADYLHNAHVESRAHCCYPLSLDHTDGLQIAHQLLRDYSTAKLVVTSRLHCALPVLSMGVPVLFVTRNINDRRFAGLLDYVNLVGLDIKRNSVEHLFTGLNPTLGLSLLSPSCPMIPAKIYAEQLSNQCQQFMGVPQQNESH
jgi:hypothetical protein